MSDHEIGPIPIGPPGFPSFEEIKRKQNEIKGIKALEKEKRENRKKELFKWCDERYAKKEDVEELRKELVELLKQYVKKEESGSWWKKKLKLLAGIGAGIGVLFLGLLAALGKLEFGKLIEILLRN